MTVDAPTRVVLYSFLTGARTPVAEFRYDTTAGVTLTVFDREHGGSVAEDFYQRGAPLDAEQRAVSRSEGPVFMRALLQPANMSYYSFVDESAIETF